MDDGPGSKVAADASGNGNTATLSGLDPATGWTTGRSGGALRCDGLGGALVANSPSLEKIATGVTIAAWVARSTISTGYVVVCSKQIRASSGEYYWLGMNGETMGFMGSGGGALTAVTIPVGVWTHVAVTHDGTTARIYTNGSLVASRNLAASFRLDSSKLVICGNQNDAAGAIQERWNGLVDELQLYSRALSAAEIAGLAK
jgi:hypothetical protein